MHITHKNWTQDDRVAPLLEAIRINPPKLVGRTDYLFGAFPFTDADYFEYVSEEVTALTGIYNEYFRQLDPISNAQGVDTYVAAVRLWCADQIHPQDLVEQVLAERMAA